MHLTVVTLAAPCPESAEMLAQSDLVGVLRAATDPGDPLEHISVQVLSHRVTLGFFMAELPREHCMLLAYAICRRALDTAPLLLGWTIAQIATATSLDLSTGNSDKSW